MVDRGVLPLWPWPPGPHHLDRQHAHREPPRCRGSAGVRLRDGVILRGPLLTDDGNAWVGSALLLQLRDHAAVEAMLASEPYAQAGLYSSVEIHDWEFGGRR